MRAMATLSSDLPSGTALPWLPEAKIVNVAGRGEFFVRHHRHADPAAPVALLLHGWTASGDLQFFTAYQALADRFSFVSIDHRGHGRGLRSIEPFTLEDAADDAAAVVRDLGIDQVIAVGYSMGGPVGLLFTKRHPELVVGVVMQATALEWRATWRERISWRILPAMGAALRSWTYPRFMRRLLEKMLDQHHPLVRYIPWIRGEISRHDPPAIVDAGRALGQYDARPWAASLGVPAASLITTNDRLVKPAKQHALANALNATIVEMTADHLGSWERPDEFAAATVALVAMVSMAADRSAEARTDDAGSPDERGSVVDQAVDAT